MSLVRAHGLLIGACALLACVQLLGALAPLDNGLLALRAQLIQRDPTARIVVVEIDAPSLRAAGEWPWPRERFATAISHLLGAGASLVGFDVDFSARSSGDDDTALQASVSAYPGSIVLPTFLQLGSGEETVPLAAISRDAVLAGVNVELDPDGSVRRYWRGFQHPSYYRASMASVLAGAPYGKTEPFFIDFGIRASRIDRISFEDIYTGDFDPARVRGKTILIGATALELGDRFTTPVQPSTPGVYVHALAYESLLQARALLTPSNLIVISLAVLALLVSWPKRGPLDLRRMFVWQGAILSAVLLVPSALQAVAPVSASLGLVLLAQTLSLIMSVWRELTRRADELIRQREAHLSFVALHDPETQLPNRRSLIEHIARQIAAQRSSGKAVIAMVIGIERFPVLRGAIGYSDANKVVQSLARRIGIWSGQAQVFHISTSTLGVVLLAADLDRGRASCAALLESLDTTAEFDGKEIETQVRVGIALDEAGAITPEKMLEQATIAIDQARIQNRRFVTYDAKETIDPGLQLALASDVHKGLAAGQFSIVYQAKVEIREGRVVGAEALLRWHHPVHGDISPDLFIRTAEETGAIDALTRWTLRQAIADQAQLQAAGIDIPISINASGRSISDPEFFPYVIEVVRQSAARICVEVTETSIIADPVAAIASIAALKAAGIGVSVDDYGSGLSSLSYLKQLEADELKIDKSLVCDSPTSPRHQLILKSTIDLAHALGMTVVAEGVENEPVRILLAAMGCDYVQGYLFSRPSSVEAFSRAWGAAPPIVGHVQPLNGSTYAKHRRG